jgi:hypothetical protein
MAVLGRALGGLVGALMMIGGVSGPALAAPDTPAAPVAAVVDDGLSCAELAATADPDGYAPLPRCELTILRAAAICLADAPVLDYAVEAVGTTLSTVTITWVDPSGADMVESGLPLQGRMYWPGTVIQDGKVVDWPGWTHNPDGTWTDYDAYSYTRPSVRIEFQVNPTAATVVTYPPATAACAGPVLDSPPTTTTMPPTTGSPVEQVAAPLTGGGVLAAPEVARVPAAPAPAQVRSAALAATGVTTGPLLVGAGLLVLLGVGLVAASARRHGPMG